jgi:hypothetical protein
VQKLVFAFLFYIPRHRRSYDCRFSKQVKRHAEGINVVVPIKAKGVIFDYEAIDYEAITSLFASVS